MRRASLTIRYSRWEIEITTNKDSDETAVAGGAAAIELLRLQEEIRRRDDFLALAAHELRNPLHALGLQITVARAAAKLAGATTVEDMLNQARVTMNRYIDRVTVLLELTRLGASAYPIELQEVDLTAVLGQALEQARNQPESHGVQLHLIAPPTAKVHSDPAAIAQIVAHLLSNAFKHSGAKDIQLILRPAGLELLEVVVADNGCGIGVEKQDLVFEKFTGSGGKAPGGATFGLGLWVARELAHALGGSVLLKSRVGEGSEFILRIPMTSPTIAPP